MKNSNIIHRFNAYQKERFPFVVLIFTTLSVVLSSAAVVKKGSSIFELWLPIVIGTITCLLFMFSVRVFDEFKDRKFDNKFHAKRPVQRGVITLNELNYINYLFIMVQALINVFFSLSAFFYWILAMIYSLIARVEFFMRDYIKKKFILYNILNMFQIFFLQIYLYILIEPRLSFKNPLLYIHFVFVLSSAAILEVGRKLKAKGEKSKGNDTYSGRYGINRASWIYASTYLFTYLLFIIILIGIGFSNLIFLLSLVVLILMINSNIFYRIKGNELSTKIISAVAILFYLSIHLLIMGAVFL